MAVFVWMNALGLCEEDFFGTMYDLAQVFAEPYRTAFQLACNIDLQLKSESTDFRSVAVHFV